MSARPSTLSSLNAEGLELAVQCLQTYLERLGRLCLVASELVIDGENVPALDIGERLDVSAGRQTMVDRRATRNRQTQVLRLNLAPLRQVDACLERALELPHVAWPAVGTECLESIGRQRRAVAEHALWHSALSLTTVALVAEHAVSQAFSVDTTCAFVSSQVLSQSFLPSQQSLAAETT